MVHPEVWLVYPALPGSCHNCAVWWNLTCALKPMLSGLSCPFYGIHAVPGECALGQNLAIDLPWKPSGIHTHLPFLFLPSQSPTVLLTNTSPLIAS